MCLEFYAANFSAMNKKICPTDVSFETFSRKNKLCDFFESFYINLIIF